MVNTTGAASVDIYVHNRDQMFFPNRKMLYGGTSTSFDLEQEGPATLELFEYKLTKIQNKAVDNPYERCDASDDSPDMTACVTRFVEETAGCRSNMPRLKYALSPWKLDVILLY